MTRLRAEPPSSPTELYTIELPPVSPPDTTELLKSRWTLSNSHEVVGELVGEGVSVREGVVVGDELGDALGATEGKARWQKPQVKSQKPLISWPGPNHTWHRCVFVSQ